MVSQYEDGPNLPTEEEYLQATNNVLNATPRPWTIRASRDASGDVGITGGGLPNVLAETFADLRFRGERNTYEARANAELIVRAVNAFEPLVEALEMIRDADEDCKRDGLTTMPPMARAKIDAALAKARGAQ